MSEIDCHAKPFSKTASRFLICEGPSDFGIISGLVRTHNISGIQLHIAKGRGKFRGALETARAARFGAVAILSDNDDNAQTSFDEVRNEIVAAGYTAPVQPRDLIPATFDNPSLEVFMVPFDTDLGNIETLCLPALEALYQGHVHCLDALCECAQIISPQWGTKSRSCLRVQCLLSCAHPTEPKIGLGHFAMRQDCPLDYNHLTFQRITEFLVQFSGRPV